MDPFSRHTRDVDRALRSHDPTAIKQAYAEFGEYLADDLRPGDTPPVLSFPETAPAVAGAVPDEAVVVLDAGCGPVPVAIRLARPGRRLIVLDISHGMVRLARESSARVGVEVIGVVGDVEGLPFRARSLPALVCDDTIEHLHDDRLAVSELARVLEGGGTAVVATPNRHGLGVLARKAADRLRGRRRDPKAYYAAASHLREYTVAELQRLVAGHFSPVRAVTVGWEGSYLRRRAASAIVRKGPMARFSKVVILVLRRLG